MITLLCAGHETTALTLAWALFEIARHADVDGALAARSCGSLARSGRPATRICPSSP